ncbi:MAG: hypothetical protein C0598_09655 [Marinilabiliales bacterium]|nr:MAG: hypothetical protein C0598_09655 [Marinilabiliales bacterium]
MKKVYFKEVQRFGSVSLYFVMGLIYTTILGYFTYALIDTFVLEGNMISGHMSPRGLVIGSVLSLLIVIISSFLLFGSKLLTEVTDSSVIYSFPPFIRVRRIISKKEISKWEIREYKPIKEYGGWGIRQAINKGGLYGKKSKTKNSAVNVGGNIGLQLTLTTGEKILVGTQRQQAIKRAMNKMFNK